jgi:hypothetical protein
VTPHFTRLISASNLAVTQSSNFVLKYSSCCLHQSRNNERCGTEFWCVQWNPFWAKVWSGHDSRSVGVGSWQCLSHDAQWAIHRASDPLPLKCGWSTDISHSTVEDRLGLRAFQRPFAARPSVRNSWWPCFSHCYSNYILPWQITQRQWLHAAWNQTGSNHSFILYCVTKFETWKHSCIECRGLALRITEIHSSYLCWSICCLRRGF